jgi:hypothetical protein
VMPTSANCQISFRFSAVFWGFSGYEVSGFEKPRNLERVPKKS